MENSKIALQLFIEYLQIEKIIHNILLCVTNETSNNFSSL